MTPLDEHYEHLIDPVNFIKNFTDENHFRNWLKSGTINDLKETLKCFEIKEMYETCTIIQSEIDKKVDVMLSGFRITD